MTTRVRSSISHLSGALLRTQEVHVFSWRNKKKQKNNNPRPTEPGYVLPVQTV